MCPCFHTVVPETSHVGDRCFAGEQVKRSKVGDGGVMTEHHGYVVGDRMREAISINLGLLALKRCIEALNR